MVTQDIMDSIKFNKHDDEDESDGQENQLETSRKSEIKSEKWGISPYLLEFWWVYIFYVLTILDTRNRKFDKYYKT